MRLKGAPGGCGAVAQMGERCNRTAEVRGSIPLSSTSPAGSTYQKNGGQMPACQIMKSVSRQQPVFRNAAGRSTKLQRCPHRFVPSVSAARAAQGHAKAHKPLLPLRQSPQRRDAAGLLPAAHGRKILRREPICGDDYSMMQLPFHLLLHRSHKALTRLKFHGGKLGGTSRFQFRVSAGLVRRGQSAESRRRSWCLCPIRL